MKNKITLAKMHKIAWTVYGYDAVVFTKRVKEFFKVDWDTASKAVISYLNNPKGKITWGGAR